MADIARAANVSKPTVSRVFNNSPLVNAETRERVLEAARAQGYVVNRNAQRLRQERANTVAVVLDFGSHRHGAIGDPFIFELLAGVSEALSVREIDLLLSPVGLDRVDGFVELHRSRGADGFIVLGQGAREWMLCDVARRGIPIVVWGAVHQVSDYCAVGSDNFLGGRLAGEHFLKMDRRRWLFVGDPAHEELRLRYDGLAEIAATHPEVRVEQLVTDSLAFASIQEAAGQYIGRGELPDAVFAFSDTAAMAIIGAFSRHGHLTPRDYSLVGYNNIPPAAHFTPAITTIEQPTAVAGAMLVEKLMQLLDGHRPKSAMLPTRLIARTT
ncbi:MULTISPECIES: LacI family DNA-binding transcriptional regulator [unclassified Sphingomonas]|uniref:LacI family DNA-binding transcriptional regulator n=1 Tax=unclassified Sphingomonas TaxID=196159 RepID=UPI000929C5EA|nr:MULTISPECIES: LacI family DNA-binding transcriptional regulator [unclassified Sphingomonas]MBN8847484.1 LacI family DNA-binding transcriptional regulator [Sphingomonas sp.]OJV32670.1 MAG: LacI family transcriptional regulator [Sphingomonas sp. 67-36]